MVTSDHLSARLNAAGHSVFSNILKQFGGKHKVVQHFVVAVIYFVHRPGPVQMSFVDENDVLIRDDGRVVALDATTVLTHRVNFYVVEDNVYDGQCDK